MTERLSPGDVCRVVSITDCTSDDEIILERSDGFLFRISQGYFDDDSVNNGILISDGYKENQR